VTVGHDGHPLPQRDGIVMQGVDNLQFPYIKPGAVDPTPQNTYSLLGTMQGILGYPRLAAGLRGRPAFVHVTSSRGSRCSSQHADSPQWSGR
jgi:hypothetical protein